MKRAETSEKLLLLDVPLASPDHDYGYEQLWMFSDSMWNLLGYGDLRRSLASSIDENCRHPRFGSVWGWRASLREQTVIGLFQYRMYVGFQGRRHQKLKHSAIGKVQVFNSRSIPKIPDLVPAAPHPWAQASSGGSPLVLPTGPSASSRQPPQTRGTEAIYSAGTEQNVSQPLADQITILLPSKLTNKNALMILEEQQSIKSIRAQPSSSLGPRPQTPGFSWHNSAWRPEINPSAPALSN